MPWAAAIGAVGSIAGGLISSSGANAAASTNQAAQQWQEQAAQPFVNAGQAAIPSLQNMAGLGSGGIAGEMAALQQTPGYQFTLNQGLNAVQNSMASQGLGVSGNALRGAAQYATGLASQTYQNQFSNMLNVAQLGANAAVGAGSNIVSAANNIGAAQQNAANAVGSGVQGAGTSAGNALLMQSLMSNQAGAGSVTNVGGGGYLGNQLSGATSGMSAVDMAPQGAYGSPYALTSGL